MRAVFLWLFYVTALLCMALPHGMRTQLTPLLDCPDIGEVQDAHCTPEALFASATNADVIRAFQTADAAFMAKKVRDGELSAWPLWPPGMIIIQTFFYRISPDLPIALVLVVLGCAVWALVLAQLAAVLWQPSRFAALMLPLLLLLSPEFHYFFGIGAFYTESLSIAFFLLGVGLLCNARHWRMAALAGVCFALSSYMRAQSDLVMSVTLACALVSLLHVKLRRQTLHASPWLLVLVALVSYHALTLPWRAAHHMQWVGFAQSPIWHETWERESDLPPGLQFYTTGGGLAGCAVDPALCDYIHTQRKLHGVQLYSPQDYLGFSLKTFARHPVKWLAFKLPYLRAFWFENAAEGTLLIVALPLLLLWCARRRAPPQLILALLVCTTTIGICGPLLLTHIEPRYLYQCKWMIFYGTILALGWNMRGAQAKAL